MTEPKPIAARRKASFDTTPRRDPSPLAAPLRGLVTMKMIILFGLLRRSGARAQRRMFDLSELEWRIMTQVGSHGRLSLNGLAELLVQDRGQLSRVVKAMVGRGLLTRGRKPGGPGIVIELSEEGEAVYGHMVEWALQRDTALTSGTSLEEVATLRQTLDRMIDKAHLLLEEERKDEGTPGRDSNP